MSEMGNSSAKSATKAVVTLLIVVLVLSVLYFSGVLSGGRRTPNAFFDSSNGSNK